MAERTSFDNNFFDIVTVGQAYHWFDFERFHDEVKRVLKPGGTIALFGYGLHTVNVEIDDIIHHFYHEVVGPYWDEERKFIDKKYQNTPFPYQEIMCPDFEFEANWSFDHYVGYIQTWSAVKHFERANGFNPMVDLTKELELHWKEELKPVKFPIFMRLGKL